MVVEAVGTAFNVEMEPSGALSVTLTEGKVNLIPVTAGASTTLTAGQAATVGGDATPRIRELRAEDIDTQLAWQRGMLIFRGETLATVLTEVGRYTTIDFEPEPRIREIRVAGFFRAGDVDGLLVALRENFDIEAQRMPDNRIVLTAR
jgi:transmembrane sensor